MADAQEVYLQVVERLPEPYLLVRASGAILGASRRVARLGIAREALAGRPLSDVAEEAAGTVADYLRRCAATAETVPGSLTLPTKGGPLTCRVDGGVARPAGEGVEALVLLRLVPRSESVAQFLKLNREIDQLGREVARRTRSEEALREQKEWLAVTLQSIGDAVIATDPAGAVIFMNPVAEGLTGWSGAEAAGRSLDEVFRIVNEETRQPVENPVTKCIREDRVVGLANHTVLIARDGTERAIDDTAAPLRKPGGRMDGVVLVFHDVGDRRVLERELNQRVAMLAEADRHKDEFLAMLAHELRNPLAAVRNAAQLIGRIDDDPAELDWAKGVVERQVRHLARLIDDLLDVARISRGTIVLRREPLALAPLIAAAVEAVRPLIDSRGHALTVTLADGLPRLEADPLRLEQVFINLLTNAAKYTDSGGHLAVTVVRDGDEIVATVRDDGAGIPAALLPRVFDLFAQGDRSIARSEGGLGIGLTLVRRLVDLHGGTVTASSPGPGLGSSFTVRLPALADVPASDGATPSPLSPSDSTPRRVLVVDDNVDHARVLGRLLTLRGHDVALAFDGPSALETARAHRPQLILLDIGLPGLDGYEVARRLRAEEGCSSSRIVAVSGYGQDDDRRRSRAAGFDDHLVKPLDYESLLALIGGRPESPASRERPSRP